MQIQNYFITSDLLIKNETAILVIFYGPWTIKFNTIKKFR